MYKTQDLGSLRRIDSGKHVTLSGWVNSIRNHGGIIFIDLRDRKGITQIVIDPKILENIESYNIKNEYVVQVKGEVRERNKESFNLNNPTGEVEVICKEINLLNKSKLPIFEVNEDSNVTDVLKMKYRYLYLRRESSYKKLKTRSDLFKAMRDFMYNEDFIEVDTPILNKSTPEGARAFLVPSRLNSGEFYALAQSPQIFKQILMVSGVERYFQIAKCFRDEDLRADRQPEFMQLDIETSFLNKYEVMDIAERLIKDIMLKVFKIEISKIPILTYEEAMNKYGIDKPDTRYGLELIDITDLAARSNFEVFKNVISKRGIIKAISVPNSSQTISRKDIDDFTKSIKVFGAKGLAWIKIDENNNFNSLLSKFIPEKELREIADVTNSKENSTIFFLADEKDIVLNSLGNLRIMIAKKLNLIDNNLINFLWVKDFPLLEFDQQNRRYIAKHHPFTLYKKEDESKLDLEPLNVKSEAYDLVLNGNEIAGGSIRLYTEEQQSKVFKALGFSEKDAEDKFGYLLEALRNGAPPHGGIAFGIDRLLAIMFKEDSIREVIAFPKTQKGQCLMSDAPSTIPNSDLEDLKIEVIKNLSTGE